jgi:putative membrane protein
MVAAAEAVEAAERDPIQLSRRLVYFAAERTLSAWIRTALSLMALGFVIDRFGLILHMLPRDASRSQLYPRMLSTWGGSLLIAMGAIMALGAGARYLHFAIAFHRKGSTQVHHGIFVGAAFAVLLALFGVVLVVLLHAILP